MRKGVGACTLGLVALGCAAPPPRAPPTSPPVAATVAASEAEPVVDVSAPPDLLMSLRLAAPARDLPVVGMLVPMPPRFAAVMAQPRLSVRFALGAVLGDAIDLDQPVDLVAPAPVAGPAGGNPQTPGSPTGEHFATAFGLLAGATEPAALGGTFRRIERGNGAIGLSPQLGAEAGMIGTSLHCDLWPAHGDQVARLVCASDAELLRVYGPFLARGIAARPPSPAALSLRVTRAAIQASVGKELQHDGGGQGGSDARKAGREVGLAWVRHYADDLEGLSASVDMPRGKVEVAFEQTFRRVSSAGAVLECASAGSPAAVPEAFWRLPADADAALFLQGAPPAVMAPLGARALDELFGSIPDVSPQIGAELANAARGLLLTGGPTVLGYGHDRAAARRSLDKLEAPPSRPSKAPPPESALLAAHAAATGWTLAHFDEPEARWSDGLRELLRLAAKPDPGPEGGSAPKPAKESRSRESFREVPVRPADRLPPGSVHFLIASRPVGHARGGRPPSMPTDTHFLIAPDGAGTWISIAEDLASARSRLLQALTPTDRTLRDRADITALRARTGAGAGYVTLAGLVSLLLDDDSLPALRDAGGTLARLASLRRQGASAVPIVWTSSAEPCRARFSAVVDADALADAVRWFTTAGGPVSP